MGAVFGRLEDGNLVARQKERYYAFLVPKSAVTIWLHGGAHQNASTTKVTKGHEGKAGACVIFIAPG
jgi:hypothetical protein